MVYIYCSDIYCTTQRKSLRQSMRIFFGQFMFVTMQKQGIRLTGFCVCVCVCVRVCVCARVWATLIHYAKRAFLKACHSLTFAKTSCTTSRKRKIVRYCLQWVRFFSFFLSHLTRVTCNSHESHMNLTCVMNKWSFVFMRVHMCVHMARNSIPCVTRSSRKSHTKSYTSHMCASRMSHLSCSRGCICLCMWEGILTSRAWHAFHTILIRISHMCLE